MNVIAHLLPTTATVGDAQRVFAENPLIAAHFERLGLDRANKARSRVPLAKVYSADVVAFLLPMKAAGRPAYVGSFNLMTAPARTLVTEALGQPLEDVLWTAETASRAADALVLRYLNPGSACAALGHLRLGISQALGLDAAAMSLSPIIAAAKREDITIKKNLLGSARLASRIDEGIELPAIYATLAALADRARAFVAAPAATPQSAADLLVILSARPGEAETLKIGERGAITGMLKKKADDDHTYNLVSAVGLQLATQYLEAWRALPSGDRRTAMVGLTRLCATWGLQRRDLRAIGAALALRHELLEGNVANTAQGRVLHAEALRHAPAKKAAAQVHYERVTDPTSKVAADLAELGADDLAEIMALIAAKRGAHA
jgi:hypothetical protein